MKALHEIPPLLVGDRVYIFTCSSGIAEARVSMVLQKSDHSWMFRATYKTDEETRQVNFNQYEINEGRVFLLKNTQKIF